MTEWYDKVRTKIREILSDDVTFKMTEKQCVVLVVFLISFYPDLKHLYHRILLFQLFENSRKYHGQKYSSNFFV